MRIESRTSREFTRVSILPAFKCILLLPAVLLLWGLPASMTAGAAESAASGSPSASASPIVGLLEGSLDKVEIVSVGGWAWDSSKPNSPIKVEIYDGTTLLTTMVAGEFREDLKKAGKGDGKHAFNYPLPETLRDGQSHTISVRYAGTTTDIPGSPKTLLFPKP
jgi:hypothetical protein